jgi:ubiquinone/menaquinone biosynthesis C-methylase UbiE
MMVYILVDLGSGAGIDVFLAVNIVKNSGKFIGIDMTDKIVEVLDENPYLKMEKSDDRKTDYHPAIKAN